MLMEEDQTKKVNAEFNHKIYFRPEDHCFKKIKHIFRL